MLLTMLGRAERAVNVRVGRLRYTWGGLGPKGSVRMSLAAATTEPSAEGRIPVLDIGAYLAGEAGSAAPLARARQAGGSGEYAG